MNIVQKKYMRKLFWVCMVALLCCACGKQKSAPQVDDALSVAVVDDTVEAGDSDTLFSFPVRENFFSGRDGIFEEFFFEFVSDTALQYRRIHFPLPYVRGGKETLLKEVEWASVEAFARMDIYMTLFERDAEMEAERDTAMQKVNVEWVDVDSARVCTFCFEKQDGCWYLLRISEQKLVSYRHREFFTFYHRFVTDSIYQSQHVHDPMTFVTVDPEDDFNILEANIDMEQWFAFRPMLPEKLLVHIDYGVKPSRRPARKILTCKGVGGNFNHTSYFRKIGGEWMLTRFEDMSN